MRPTLKPPASHADSATAAIAAACHGWDHGSTASTQPETRDPHEIDR